MVIHGAAEPTRGLLNLDRAHSEHCRGIGLEAAGVCLDARGFIRFNERLETTALDVWAIGDCAGSPQFTHVSVR